MEIQEGSTVPKKKVLTYSCRTSQTPVSHEIKHFAKHGLPRAQRREEPWLDGFGVCLCLYPAERLGRYFTSLDFGFLSCKMRTLDFWRWSLRCLLAQTLNQSMLRLWENVKQEQNAKLREEDVKLQLGDAEI